MLHVNFLLCYNSVLVHIDVHVSVNHASSFIFEGSGSQLKVKLVIILVFLDPFLQLLKWWHIVDNNLIDIRGTNNIVKWQQHVSTRYPKRPLQVEIK
jgi:hypothetical protein